MDDKFFPKRRETSDLKRRQCPYCGLKDECGCKAPIVKKKLVTRKRTPEEMERLLEIIKKGKETLDLISRKYDAQDK